MASAGLLREGCTEPEGLMPHACGMLPLCSTSLVCCCPARLAAWPPAAAARPPPHPSNSFWLPAACRMRRLAMLLSPSHA